MYTFKILLINQSYSNIRSVFVIINKTYSIFIFRNTYKL